MTGREENEQKIFNRIENKLKECPEYVKEWYLHLRANKSTASTCDVYIRKIYDFLLDICENKKNVKNVTIDMITYPSIERYLLSKQYKEKDGEQIKTSDSYQAGIWTALNTFLDFLKKRGYIKENYIYAQDIKKPRVRDKIERKHLSKEDFKKIIEVANKGSRYNWDKSRDKAILYLFMTTGMRRSAMSQINLSDLDIKGDKINPNSLFKIIDKGEKHHDFVLTQGTVDAINGWLKWRLYTFKDSSTDSLFVNKQGDRLSGEAIRRMVIKYSEEALGYSLSPHKLRGAFITIIIEETGSIMMACDAVGHSNIKTTQRYFASIGQGKKAAAKIMGDI